LRVVTGLDPRPTAASIIALDEDAVVRLLGGHVRILLA